MRAFADPEDCLDFAGSLAGRVEKAGLSRREAEAALAERAANGCPLCRRTYEESLALLYGPRPGLPRVRLRTLGSPAPAAAAPPPGPPRRDRRKKWTPETLAVCARDAFAELQAETKWARRRERVDHEWFKFRGTTLARLLLDAARAALPGAPEEAAAWTELALCALAGKREEMYPDREERVLLGLRAQLFQANAHRLRGEHGAAHELIELTFSMAEELEVRDLAFWAEAKSFVASLRLNQRVLDEAVREGRASAALYREAGLPHLEVQTRWQLAVIHEQGGDFASGLAAIREALPQALRLMDSKLELGVRHFEVLALARLGRAEEAKKAFSELAALYSTFPDRNSARAWVLSLIEAGLGHPAEAEAAFQAARDGFLADRNAYDAALVTLDWSLFLLDQGRAEEVLPLAVSMGQAFEALGVARETMASWAIFQAAAERRELDRTVAEQIGRTLGDERGTGRRGR